MIVYKKYLHRSCPTARTACTVWFTACCILLFEFILVALRALSSNAEFWLNLFAVLGTAKFSRLFIVLVSLKDLKEANYCYLESKHRQMLYKASWFALWPEIPAKRDFENAFRNGIKLFLENWIVRVIISTILRSLRKGVLSEARQTEVRPFLFLICLDANKFVLLSVFTLNYRDDLSENLVKITSQDCKQPTFGWSALLKNVVP